MKKKNNYKTAVFAGGCFWCIEAAMEELEGVTEAINGYTGGSKENPTYQEVSTGTTGHFEATKVIYNPDQISYRELLDRFFQNIDPTDPTGQFADKGSQYQTAVFYQTEEQKDEIKKKIDELKNSGKFSKPIVTKILPESTFYPAAEYNQDYYKKQSSRYKSYKKGSGREDYIKDTWD